MSVACRRRLSRRCRGTRFERGHSRSNGNRCGGVWTLFAPLNLGAEPVFDPPFARLSTQDGACAAASARHACLCFGGKVFDVPPIFLNSSVAEHPAFKRVFFVSGPMGGSEEW